VLGLGLYLVLDDITVYPCDSKPYGRSYIQWSTLWWQWLLSIPKRTSPAIDFTGQYGSLNQSDPNVFFLCQTFENPDSMPIRKIVVPSGKAIFMPIINWISVTPDDGINDMELQDTAKRKIDTVFVQELQISVDHRRIGGFQDYRVSSFPFEVCLPDDNLLNLKKGPTRCVSDGYWILFELPNRSHVISSYGCCSLGVTKIGISYALDFHEKDVLNQL